MDGARVVIDLTNSPSFEDRAVLEFVETSGRYLKAVGDSRKVVTDPEARYWGSRVEEFSLVPVGEARLGRIGLNEWLGRSSGGA